MNIAIKPGTTPFAVAVVLAGCWMAAHSAAWAQPAPDLQRLHDEIQSLKEGQNAIQQELEAIKRLLQQRPPAPAAQAPQPPRVAAEPVDMVLSIVGAPAKGAAEAKVAVIEFTDYQCPFCARHAGATLAAIENDYVQSGKVRYVLRDFPIASIHPQAAKAHQAAYCAGDQGKYWDMHRQLFANQRKLGALDLLGYAQGLGLEAKAFESCMDGGKYAGAVEKAFADGEKGGVTGTPTFFLGLIDPATGTVKVTRRIRGAHPYVVFKEAIESLLRPPT